MELEDVLSNIQAVPKENMEELKKELMNYFPIVVDLLSRCRAELVDFWVYYIEPSERKDGFSADELPLRPDLNLALSHCAQMDELLERMFKNLQVKKPAA